MTSPTPITGTVVSASLNEAAPGEATYGINFTRGDGSLVRGVTGHRTIFAYVWPDFARVEPARLIGKRVHGLELNSGHIWWMFIEPPKGSRCGDSTANQRPDTGETPSSGGGGTS